MLTLKDPILTAPPPPDGIELPPLREPESLEMSDRLGDHVTESPPD